MPSRYPHHRQGLTGSLIDPAGGKLVWLGDANLDSGRIGKVNQVGLHAESFAPLGVATGSLVVVAAVRTDDAEITGSQLFETGIAIALAEAPLGLSATTLAEDGTCIAQFDLLPQVGIEGNRLVSETQRVLHRLRQVGSHFAERTVCDGVHLCTLSRLASHWLLGSTIGRFRDRKKAAHPIIPPATNPPR